MCAIGDERTDDEVGIDELVKSKNQIVGGAVCCAVKLARVERDPGIEFGRLELTIRAGQVAGG